MKTTLVTFYELSEEEKKRLVTAVEAEETASTDDETPKLNEMQPEAEPQTLMPNKYDNTPPVDDTKTPVEGDKQNGVQHDNGNSSNAEDMGYVTNPGGTEQPDALISMLNAIISDLENENNDNMTEAMLAARQFLITYQPVLESMSNPEGPHLTFNQISDIIRRLKMFEIIRKELIEYLYNLIADIKSANTAREISELLLNFANLPLDDHARRLLKVLGDKVMNIKF